MIDFDSKCSKEDATQLPGLQPDSHGQRSNHQSMGMSKPITCCSAKSVKRNWRDQPHVGKYKLLRTLGRGNFAKVKLAQHITTGEEVAVKVIDKSQLSQASLSKLYREVKFMKMLSHPNIVQLYEVIESDNHVYLVMEFAPNGELFDFLTSNGRLKEKDARQKFRQIVSAVQYCHQKSIVHRDLKAENLLLDSSYNIKLADFGFANTFSSSVALDTFCGSPPYAAPELFLGRKYHGPEVDVWSLGVILYTVVSGYLPFDAQNLQDLRERILRGKFRVPFYMSSDCELLLRKMLVLNPDKRHSLLAVMQDKWINLGYEDNNLKPYLEPPLDYTDPLRLCKMVRMGFTIEDIQDSLQNQRFNNITATYLLLADSPKSQDFLKADSSSNLRVNSTTTCSEAISTTNNSSNFPSCSEQRTSENGHPPLNSSSSRQDQLEQKTVAICPAVDLVSAGEEAKRCPIERSEVKRAQPPSSMRRTQTFSSADKHRDTFPRLGHNGFLENGLVRVQNLNNIVSVVSPPNGVFETALAVTNKNGEQAVYLSGSTQLASRSVDSSSERTLIEDHLLLNPTPHTNNCSAPQRKPRDSFWKRLQRSFSWRKKRPLVGDNAGTPNGAPRDEVDRLESRKSSLHLPPTGDSPERAPEQDPPFKNDQSDLLFSDHSQTPITCVEQAITYQPTYTCDAFLRKFTSSVSRSFRLKPNRVMREHSFVEAAVEGSHLPQPPKGCRDRRLSRDQSSSPPLTDQMNDPERDPWSRMSNRPSSYGVDSRAAHNYAYYGSDEKHHPEKSPLIRTGPQDTHAPLDGAETGSQLTATLPSCAKSIHHAEPSRADCALTSPRTGLDFSWGQKPRKVALSRTFRIIGRDPLRLITAVTEALTRHDILFLLLGEYRLQFLFSPSSVSAQAADNALLALMRPSPREGWPSSSDVSGTLEVCQVLATSIYAVRFKRLSGETHNYKLFSTALTKLIKSAPNTRRLLNA